MDFGFVESLQLNLSRVVDALANDIRTFTGVFAGELLIAQSGNFNLNVDAVEQRTGDARTVALDLQRRAYAFFLRIGEEAADARVHRRDQHKTSWIVDRAHGAGDGDVAVFQGLAHDFQNVATELG